MSLELRFVWFLLSCCFLLAPSRQVKALDLSVDSFYSEQSITTTTAGELTQNTKAVEALGGFRTITALVEASTGSATISIANHTLEGQVSEGAQGRLTVVWDGDGLPGLSPLNILNGSISVPRCDALLITMKSSTHPKNTGTISVRLYDPFSKGDRFLEGGLQLSSAISDLETAIPISTMVETGSRRIGADFPVGPIVITIDHSVSLSSVRLRCPPEAFVDLEKASIEFAEKPTTAKNRSAARSSVREPASQATPATTPVVTPTATPPTAVCGDGIIQAGEECDPGISNMGSSCVSCSIQCAAPTAGKQAPKTLAKSAKAKPGCAPPPTCAAPYKSCSQSTKGGGSACCYDPKTEDCITFTTWGHPVARCVPKSGACTEPEGKECKSGKGDRTCCPSTPETSCAQGGGIAFCSFSACGPNQTACKTATGMRSEATMCCSNDTEQCKTTIEILGYLIQTCTANETSCINTGGTLCLGNGTPRCCPTGTVCSSSIDGFPNCVDVKRTGQSPESKQL